MQQSFLLLTVIQPTSQQHYTEAFKRHTWIVKKEALLFLFFVQYFNKRC